MGETLSARFGVPSARTVGTGSQRGELAGLYYCTISETLVRREPTKYENPGRPSFAVHTL